MTSASLCRADTGLSAPGRDPGVARSRRPRVAFQEVERVSPNNIASSLARSRFGAHGPQQRLVTGGLKVERVTFLDGLAGRPSHRRRPCRGEQQFRYGPGHGRGVEAEDHPTIHPVGDGVGNTADAEGDRRRAAGHGLQHHVRLVVLGEV